ncbi:hypothetical protein G6O69_17910 [Pseudenhygromyxa sp. WMMC2535]|uniref:hypothetical protein n=1 Tax=Pseudenhygromyxa sp. WMMC2535 TaxID=2712867 RepID=UPI0015516D4C|nr:hypothetical protein [Pseudenhygromyxa sp. WMMC2535]NVB39724.1 hypothetical protein [Pseudenhygromyxa sp. WMMC2535]
MRDRAHDFSSVISPCLALVILLAPQLGCERPSTTAEASSKSGEAPPKPAAASPGAGAATAPGAGGEDPERADKLADLEDMCVAIDHDYKDGTLGDYYADIEPRTAWGRKVRDAGNESIQPGRLLEKEIQALDPSGREPALKTCRVLLDYLDDVE